MRKLAPALCLVVALVCAAGASPATGTHVVGLHGIRAVAPPSWHLTNEVLSICTSPSQTMAITNARGLIPADAKLSGKVGLVLLMEAKGGGGEGFTPRRMFGRLPSSSAIGGCCDMPEGRGVEFVFRDHGRDFYAFLYAADPSIASEGLAILNSLQVRKL